MKITRRRFTLGALLSALLPSLWFARHGLKLKRQWLLRATD